MTDTAATIRTALLAARDAGTITVRAYFGVVAE